MFGYGRDSPAHSNDWYQELSHGEQRPSSSLQKCIAVSFKHFWSFCSRIPDVARIVRPHSDYGTHVLQQAVTSLLEQSTVSKQKFNYGFLYLHNVLRLEDQFSALEDAIVGLRVDIPFGSLLFDSTRFWWGVSVTTNHLNINSVWKLLIASCVYVAEVGNPVFNRFVSSTKVFVSSTKHVCLQRQSVPLQHKTCSLLHVAINVFVCSVISYFEWNEFYLKVGLETPTKTDTGKKFSETSFQVRMDL